MTTRYLLLGLAALTTIAAVAEDLALVSPKAGETVALIPAEYKAYLAKDRAERRKLFSDMTVRAGWCKVSPGSYPLSVTFAWKGATGGELQVERLPDRKLFFKGAIPSNTYALANFEIARTYSWRVTAGGKTQVGEFKTEDVAPRMIRWPGISNMRDLGGRKGLGGKRVKQGMIYRNAGLNSNASFKFLTEDDLKKAYAEGKLEEVIKTTVDSSGAPSKAEHYAKKIGKMLKKGEKLPKRYVDRKFLISSSATPGKKRLTPENLAWGLDFFGIKTDLDLRTWRECWGMTGSPLGPTVKWINYSSAGYGGMADDFGRDAFTKCFKVFLDAKNYPIDFHCIAGADRTGSLAFILNGLLGVDEEELYRDWEVTGLTNTTADFNHKSRFDKLVAVFDKYEGATINERVEKYVLSLGFTAEDIAAFRKLMLED